MDRRGISFLSLIGLVACGSAAYELKDVAGNSVPGIPFFPIVASQATITTYQQTWLAVTMSFVLRPETRTDAEIAKETKAGKWGPPPPSAAKPDYTDTATRYLDLKDPSYANQIQTAFAKKAAVPQVAHDDVYSMFAACLDNNAKPVGKQCSAVQPDVLPMKDILGTLPRVGKDLQILHSAGTRPMYINSKAPFGGSANAAFQFAPDGTLTAASSQVQDQLPATIASSLTGMVSSLVTGSSKSTGAATTSNGEGKPWVLSGSMTVTQIVRLYTLTVVQALNDDGGVGGTCGAVEIQAAFEAPTTNPAVCRVTLTTQVVRGDQGLAPAASASTAGNVIQFSGAVVLPPAASGSASAAPTASTAAVGGHT